MARTLLSLKQKPVTEISGVGPKAQASLATVEPPVETVYDLLTYYPRRYIDRTNQAMIRDLAVGEEAMVLAKVKRVQARRTRQGRSLVEVDVFDGSSYLKCTFFNQPWRAKQLVVGREAVFFGKLDLYKGRRQMTSPVVDLIGDRTGKILPVYPQSEKAGLTTWDLAGWIEEALGRARDLADPLDDRRRDRLKLIDRTRALRSIHAPDSLDDARHARRRLVFDELLRLQVTLVLRKRAFEREAKGIRHQTDGELVRSFHRGLPFDLTGAQRRAIDEIAADLAGPHPMHRLLQGDVGSGKTLVALTALLMGVQGGYQGALMAPTEVLAEQHFAGIRAQLDGLEVTDGADSLFPVRPLRFELLTNRTTAGQRTKLQAALAAGDIDILIGTHALLTEAFGFKALGVIVIDEQHRFGVEQRSALRDKGADPDVLVMTATPIPRTAAMTVYGDLDMTVLDELPPGRTPIDTTWARGPLEEAATWEAVRSAVAAGHQAYVVCPLIEESEKVEARSAEEEFARLQAGELEGLRLAVLHGRVPAKDKEARMAAFRRGDVDVLVATTVIEVGVDVPNATVMVIEDADRFGIAQLHQLRGRVGRGGARSKCFLLGDTESPDGEARLKAVESSTDGFALAEVDLELRGEGAILGIRQKGRSDLKLASLRRDKELVKVARDVAFEVVAEGLERHPVLADEVRELVEPEEAAFLFKS
ncbi:MAG: RecG [uncultured Acidimicrobiales bacterium]|uniref:ATP-dependent DNA helicase RecG n=1 Tax=uncultured Acidimicrobiales bacterium TaxID=310071 RepID=A0A6J4HM15_9ACTN|nr:MAG: RecG [uncultured Acidimicrobiales bacterium]